MLTPTFRLASKRGGKLVLYTPQIANNTCNIIATTLFYFCNVRLYAVILLLIMSSTVVRAGGPLMSAIMTCESTCTIDQTLDTSVTCSADDAISCCGGDDSQESGCCTSGDCDCTCCVHVVALTSHPALCTVVDSGRNYSVTPAYECNYYHLRGSSTFRPPLV